MKIGLRILLGYFLVVGLAAWFLLNVFVEQVKPGVRSTQEDTLVDTAQLLALLVADDVKAGSLFDPVLQQRLRQYGRRDAAADVGGVARTIVESRIYITDARGIVLFDSSGLAFGQDYSRWNDVYLTLRGQYGARSTRAIAADEASTVMHVAAPVRDGARIIGVVTVAKPNASAQPFVERSQRKILQRGTLLLALSLLIGLLFTWWLARLLRKLMAYIADVEADRKTTLPALGNNEIGTLGRALEAMRTRLEGKEYVEQLMHTLAHELKSPIAAIQGAAELLQEDMPAPERRHFLATILHQNSRQKQLIDKLLALVRLEKQQHLNAPERIEIGALLEQAVADSAARLASRGQTLELDGGAGLRVVGDTLLLRQALGNLLDNAADFSPDGALINVRAARDGNQLQIDVCDSGTGIPDYAAARLFERFYSLPRPGGAKSTGLGLPFVREVMALHHGTVTLANRGEGGVRATLRLPL